jgi:enoyl-CoA hydratase
MERSEWLRADMPDVSSDPNLPDSVVQLQEIGSVLLARINRPHARNAIDNATAQALSDAFEHLDTQPHLSVAVLTGNGSAFCAGMDLKAFARGESVRIEPRGFAGIARRPPTKPVIAAVEGFALGGGFEIALACDIIVAAEDATFALPEVTRGLTANAGGLIRLHRQIPHHLAMELVLTGDRMSAARAAEIGLVNRVTPHGHALTVAMEVAEKISNNAPLALVASKRVMVESADWKLSEAFDRQESIVDPIRRSADAAEGARAFAEKRAPIWTNR